VLLRIAEFPKVIRHFSICQHIYYRKFDTLVYYYVLYSDYANFWELWCAIICNRLFLVWLDPSVECRHVQRNMILWTFLAYIATHYVIESERLTLASRGQYWTIDCRTDVRYTSDNIECIAFSICKSYKNRKFSRFHKKKILLNICKFVITLCTAVAER